MSLQPGTDLLHYRVVEKLGEGGMGVVWKALDTSLDREVAIKVLPPDLATNPDRLARFEREARLLASLHHPNIASVFGLHEADGLRFLAMEYVPGEDLAQRLLRGPLPVDEAMEIAGQVSDALQVAHEQGIIHRDLKPANVRLTPEGKVKVLDFGLAKALDPAVTSGSGAPSTLPTITSAGSVAGMILGTAAYMSPEQARGRKVDRRTDVWAFGCLYYEMLTGRRAFDGETITDVLAAIVTREPNWEALPDDTPAAVKSLLQLCLQKDAGTRLRDIGDGLLLVRLRPGIGAGIGAGGGGGDSDASDAAAAVRAGGDPVRQRLLPWAVAVVMALIALTVWFARPGGDALPLDGKSA
jgi:serine/threonine protein kinase